MKLRLKNKKNIEGFILENQAYFPTEISSPFYLPNKISMLNDWQHE